MRFADSIYSTMTCLVIQYCLTYRTFEASTVAQLQFRANTDTYRYVILGDSKADMTITRFPLPVRLHTIHLLEIRVNSR